MHWLLYHSGLTSATSVWYLFWSGIGADWTRLLTLGGVITLVRQRSKHHADMKELHKRQHAESMEVAKASGEGEGGGT